MNFILLFTISICIFLPPETLSEKNKADWNKVAENLNKGIQFATDVGNASKSGDVLGLINTVTDLASEIPGPIGAFFTGVSAIVSIFRGGSDEEEDQNKGPDWIDATNEQLANISKKMHELEKSLDVILNAVDETQLLVKLEVRSLPLKMTKESLEALKENYDSLRRSVDNRKIAEFLTTCNIFLIHDKVKLLRNMLTSNAYGLKATILSTLNEPSYNLFSTSTIQLLFDALMLRSACVAVKYRNESFELQEKYKEDVMKESRMIFSQILDTLKTDAEFWIYEAPYLLTERYMNANITFEVDMNRGPNLWHSLITNIPSGKFVLLYHQYSSSQLTAMVPKGANLTTGTGFKKLMSKILKRERNYIILMTTGEGKMKPHYEDSLSQKCFWEYFYKFHADLRVRTPEKFVSLFSECIMNNNQGSLMVGALDGHDNYGNWNFNDRVWTKEWMTNFYFRIPL